MSIFGRSFGESASDVRKSYASRIGDFLSHVERPSGSIFRRRANTLDDLFTWGWGVLGEKQKLEHQLALQAEAYQKAQEEIDRLKEARDVAESGFQHVSAELQQVSIDFQNALVENTRMAEHHTHEINELILEHSKSMHDTKTRLKTDHGREVERFNKEIDRLVGQLLVNQNDSQAWPDDKLKLKFRELQRLIESVTSPRNKQFLVPHNQQLGARLDPANFLSRVGRGKSHFLLKSTIWAIFQEQFFSAPFGFGALGPGKAQRELMDVYFTWRKIFDGPTGIASPGGESFAIFHQDKLANNWRSATFQCIIVALTSTDGRNPAPDTPLAKLSAKNVNQTISRIMGVLSEVSKLSNSMVGREIEDEIHQMANLSLEIALQFGVHSAQLRLSAPSRGEQIMIGEEFHDCEDGDSSKGSAYVVDLVIVPGLQKVGDGRSDMTSKRTIVPCEIYPE
ncbi:hypothetical protein FGG08_005910 [Glutinoglossum americanum]|uniref:Uncharacterized protein n=1 Tax=Glutinoglossum americanum TaxID=1670608 RepID=A0A9P8KVJ6_9PEZI|nr:hypothetical protein FGG08_005910 [Glutinoglossum americanum]